MMIIWILKFEIFGLENYGFYEKKLSGTNRILDWPIYQLIKSFWDFTILSLI